METTNSNSNPLGLTHQDKKRALDNRYPIDYKKSIIRNTPHGNYYYLMQTNRTPGNYPPPFRTSRSGSIVEEDTRPQIIQELISEEKNDLWEKNLGDLVLVKVDRETDPSRYIRTALMSWISKQEVDQLDIEERKTFIKELVHSLGIEF